MEVASHLNGPYVASLLLFIAAMLCKSSVVMFPFVLLLYAWWRRGRVDRRDMLGTAPFFAVSLALGLVTVWFQENRAIEDLAVGQGGVAARLVIAGRAIAFYLGKAVWPVGLLPVYPRWIPVVSPVTVLGPWLVVVAILFWLVRMGRQAWARHALLGLGFFLINLMPVLGFLPMSYLRFSWVADHFAYLPLVGIAGLAAAGLDPVFRGLRMAGWVAAAALVAVLAAGSRAHVRIYRDEETLWTRTLALSPGSWLAENNLGNVLFQSGRTAAAFPHFADAVRLNPEYPEAQDNLGTSLVRAGRVREGIAHYGEALRLKPDFPMAEYNLGLALRQDGRPGEAMLHLGKAVMLQPGLAGPHNAMGVILAAQGRIDEAIAQFETALRLDPGLAEARHNLAVLRGHP
jgi:Tfp pilus assembly protein PilF